MDKYKTYQDKEAALRKRIKTLFVAYNVSIIDRARIQQLARQIHTMKMLKDPVKCDHAWAFDINGDPEICTKCFGSYDELYGK